MKIGSDLGTERRRSLTVASIGPQQAFVTITIVYPGDVNKDEITLPISLVCASDDDACNDSESPDGEVKKPESLDFTKPVCSRQVDGEIKANREDDMWFAQYQYYRLTSITMYKSHARISGFSVKYEVPDDEDEFTGWDSFEKLFGYMHLDTETETVNLDNDLQALEICGFDKEFAGFNLIEYGGKQTILSPGNCKES